MKIVPGKRKRNLIKSLLVAASMVLALSAFVSKSSYADVGVYVAPPPYASCYYGAYDPSCYGWAGGVWLGDPHWNDGYHRHGYYGHGYYHHGRYGPGYYAPGWGYGHDHGGFGGHSGSGRGGGHVGHGH